jgi:hypothetical protein
VEGYEKMMRPWKLIAQEKRLIEPGYPRADVGSYLLFWFGGAALSYD